MGLTLRPAGGIKGVGSGRIGTRPRGVRLFFLSEDLSVLDCCDISMDFCTIANPAQLEEQKIPTAFLNGFSGSAA